MGFRFRRSFGSRGFRINLSKRGISSISVGGPGASVNLPVERPGGTRYTVGIPGSGVSWSREVKSLESQSSPAKGVLAVAAPFIALFLLVAIFVGIGTRERNVAANKDARKETLASPALPEDIKVVDVSLGPVACTPGKTPLQCSSTGVFIFFTIVNKSAVDVCSVRGEVGMNYNGVPRVLGGNQSIFLAYLDNNDSCLKPGESWRDVAGMYIPNSSWSRGGYSSPYVTPVSVSSEKW